MLELKLVYGPHGIFKKTASPITEINEEIELLCESLVQMLYSHDAIGIAAPMVGVLERVIAYDLQEDGEKKPVIMINPEIIKASAETQVFEEGSICFPGVLVEIERAKEITVSYQDINGEIIRMDAEGWLATVIQHEIDYLDGKIIFDYLSPMKRSLSFKKTKKYQKHMNF